MFNFFKKKLKTVVRKVKDLKLSELEFDEIFFDLEIELIQNNYTPEIIDLIKKELEKVLINQAIKNPEKEVKKAISDIFKKTVISKNLIKEIKGLKKPVKLLFIGFNGVGKTTTIAKLSKLLNKNKLSNVLVASDTFRSASIEQLKAHADKLGVGLIKQRYGSDPTAVAFDAVNHAKSKGLDVVLIDTAGRSYDNINLMNELNKLKKIIKPEITILVLDSLTGSDLINQAIKFNDLYEGVNGLILTKTDIDEGGGAVLSAPYALKIPLYFIGTGQEYDDLKIPEIDLMIKEIF